LLRFRELVAGNKQRKSRVSVSIHSLRPDAVGQSLYPQDESHRVPGLSVRNGAGGCAGSKLDIQRSKAIPGPTDKRRTGGYIERYSDLLSKHHIGGPCHPRLALPDWCFPLLSPFFYSPFSLMQATQAACHFHKATPTRFDSPHLSTSSDGTLTANTQTEDSPRCRKTLFHPTTSATSARAWSAQSS
jgi:hypothetical protein